MGGQNRPIVSFFEVLAPPHEGATSAGGVLGGQSTFWPDHGGVTSKIVGGQPKIRVAPPNDGGGKILSTPPNFRNPENLGGQFI